MPSLETLHWGAVEYDASQVIEFDGGLPAFEDQSQFLIVERDTADPMVFLQSLTRPDLVFMTVRVRDVLAGYRLELNSDDAAALGNGDVEVLAIVTVRPDGVVTANLQAPVVVNRATGRAVQSIQPGGGHALQHVLGKPRCL